MVKADRCFLCSRLIADGITEPLLMFKFFPDYLDGLKKNPVLTFTDGFHVLIESIEMLEDFITQRGIMISGTAVVDISELARIASTVRTVRIFRRSVQFLEVRSADSDGQRFRLLYPREFWTSVTSITDTTGEKSLRINDLERNLTRSARGQLAIS